MFSNVSVVNKSFQNIHSVLPSPGFDNCIISLRSWKFFALYGETIHVICFEIIIDIICVSVGTTIMRFNVSLIHFWSKTRDAAIIIALSSDNFV